MVMLVTIYKKIAITFAIVYRGIIYTQCTIAVLFYNREPQAIRIAFFFSNDIERDRIIPSTRHVPAHRRVCLL